MVLISGSGVVQSVTPEGMVAPCWYIETIEGTRYEPDLLREELKVPGTRIGFFGDTAFIPETPCGVGTPIHLLDAWPVMSWPLYVAVLSLGGVVALGYILYKGLRKG